MGGAGLGFDLVEVERLEQALERHPRLERRLFTPGESAYAGRKPGRPCIWRALRAKEAVGKLLAPGCSRGRRSRW